MSNNERKQMIENMSEQFAGLDETDKVYITGYVAGTQAERQKWENKEKEREAAVATA